MAVMALATIGAIPGDSSDAVTIELWRETAISSDGAYRIGIRTEENGTEIRCTNGMKETWRRFLAVTPKVTVVTDHGQVVMTGERRGRGFERGRRQNYFVFAILDVHGQLLQYQHVMLSRHTPRCGGRYWTRGSGLIVDGDTALAAVRMAPVHRMRGEWWWFFSLTSGNLLGDLHSWDAVEGESMGSFELRDARLIPGMDFVATLWSTDNRTLGADSKTGDRLFLISLIHGTGVARSLPDPDRAPHFYLTDVDTDFVRLASIAGVELEYGILRRPAGKVNLSGP